ncbi:Nn.00g037090.m01.CDS01 [Neocucurbitaria sp. VM-36]
MDEALLSLSNLRSLDITVLSHSEQPETESEMFLLRTCLLRATNLKHLRLRVSLDTSGVNPHYHHGQLNIPFEKGDHVSSLEELSLDPLNQYYWPTLKHCEMWAQCMDWDAMRVLDFGYGCPQYFFKVLTGRVPQLISLTFGTSARSDRWNQLWTGSKDLNLISQFLQSIQALEAVKLYATKDEDVKEIRSTLLSEHGQSLKQFSVEVSSNGGWDAESFLELRTKAPSMEKLTVPLRMQKVEGFRGNETVWPDVSLDRSKLATRFSMLFPPSSSLKSPRKFSLSWLKAPFTKRKEINLSSMTPAEQGYKTSKPPLSQKSPTSVHEALTSFPCLRDLRLKVFLEHDSCQLIEDEREIHTWGQTRLKQKVATNLVLRLWHESVKRDFMEVAFHAPEPCSKVWTFTVQCKWRGGEKRLDLNMEEEGHNYNPASFDPFG